MTISTPHDPDQSNDISTQLSAIRAQLCAMQADLDAFTDDRKWIVSTLASLTVDVARLTHAASARLPESVQDGSAA